jgi:farnesyl diphosphate synthase
VGPIVDSCPVWYYGDFILISFPNRHSLIVIYKTAYYSFYLPVALALYFCQVPASYKTKSGQTVEPLKTSLDILLPLGEYFQVQDDFLDFAGTPEQIGKIGTDIIDNKCSWCVNTALALVTPEQRKLLDENYGRKDPAAEKRVKELYEELGIREKYAKYEEEVVGQLRQKIESIPEDGVEGELKREVFTSFLGKIYKRQK